MERYNMGERGEGRRPIWSWFSERFVLIATYTANNILPRTMTSVSPSPTRAAWAILFALAIPALVIRRCLRGSNRVKLVQHVGERVLILGGSRYAHLTISYTISLTFT